MGNTCHYADHPDSQNSLSFDQQNHHLVKGKIPFSRSNNEYNPNSNYQNDYKVAETKEANLSDCQKVQASIVNPLVANRKHIEEVKEEINPFPEKENSTFGPVGHETTNPVIKDNNTGIHFSAESAELCPNPRTTKAEKMNDLNQVTSKIHKNLNKLSFNSLMGFLVTLKGSKSKQTRNMIQFVDFDGLEPYLEQKEGSDCEMKGPFRYPNGATYYGQYKGSARNGFGTQIWKDGSIYEGLWSGDYRRGYGRQIYQKGDYYEGSWDQNKASGSGTYLHVDGTKYQGSLVDDLQHGSGKETWRDGSVYQGEYKNAQKHGKGVFKWKDKTKFDGHFKENEMDGMGTFTWPDGRIYKGMWRKGKMQGRGTFTWPDGRKYIGEYKDDLKYGYGVFTW